MTSWCGGAVRTGFQTNREGSLFNSIMCTSCSKPMRPIRIGYPYFAAGNCPLSGQDTNGGEEYSDWPGERCED